MTTLYKPVTIETVEQAEALPIGTVARADYIPEGWTYVTVRVRGGWHDEHFQATGPLPHSEVVSMTALVPIEAEEETSVVVRAAGLQNAATHPYSEASMDSDGNVWFDGWLNRVDVTDEFNEWAKQHTRTRLVTPWESV